MLLDLHWLPFVNDDWRAVTFGQVTLLFVSPDDEDILATLNHEAIHRAQFKECGGFFKLKRIYVDERLQIMKHRGVDKKTASMLTRFEREAYRMDGDFNYLKRRRGFEWKNLKILIS